MWILGWLFLILNMDRINNSDETVEFFRITSDTGIDIDGWQMKPPDFDSLREYPVLFYLYGESMDQKVQDRWLPDQDTSKTK